jgi:L-lactate dehydrogenase
MKVAIIGTGAVGAASLIALVMRGCASEIILIDRTQEKARGLATDVRYGATLSPPVAVRAGDYSDLMDAALVIVTAGVNERSGGAIDRSDPVGRLRLLDTNVAIYRDIISRLDAVAPGVLVLVVTDPPDPLADLVRLMGHKRVLSTGTYLDSLRFRYHLALRFGVSANSVGAQVLGEHGTSEVFVWSSAHIAGTPIHSLLAQQINEDFGQFRREIENEVRYANISIIEGIGASQHGIGMVSARIAEIILRDERVAIPIGCYNPEYEVTLSLPSIVGREGVIQILPPDLSREELEALKRSADALRAAVGGLRR